MIADVQNQNMNAPVMQSQAANQKNLETTKNTRFFQEGPETYSSMRLMCFASLLTAIPASQCSLAISNGDTVVGARPDI